MTEPHTDDHSTTTFRDDDEGDQWWVYCYQCQRRISRFTPPADDQSAVGSAVVPTDPES